MISMVVAGTERQPLLFAGKSFLNHGDENTFYINASCALLHLQSTNPTINY